MQDSTLTVLVIEDNQMFRNLALKLLPPCKKITATTAEQGLVNFKRYNPDITFLDIGLPDKSGLDLLKDIKSYNPDAFVIMLTMSRISSDVDLAIRRGAAGYVIKPYSPEVIRKYFDRFGIYKQKIANLSPEEKAKFYLEMFSSEDTRTEDAIIENPEDLLPTKKDVLASWNILFVDDFLNNRVHAKKHIEQFGCKVDIAGDGATAAQMAQKTNYQLIFLDCKMPDIDGYETTKIIRKHQKDKNIQSIIIGLSDSLTEAEMGKWRQAGMDSFLVKPIQFSKLTAITDKYVNDYITKSNSTLI